MEHKHISLLFRRSRPNANYSIEASFDQMVAALPAGSGILIHKHYAPEYSNGLLPRLRLIRWAAQHRSDVNHITGDIYFIALGLPRKNTVLTIHDCGFMAHPKPFLRFFLWLLWLKIPVWWCRYITAVSEATKSDVIRYTGCRPEKITVIPTIIKSHFRRVDKPFNTTQPRVLHIGTAPNKNLERHIEALQGMPVHLHVIGALNDGQKKRLEGSQIPFTNSFNLTDEQVLQAYADADVLLFASTLEGFGMPILEAQTVGRPVVTSNLSSMPRVAGEGACLVDPHDAGSIRQGLIKVLNDEAYRNQIVQAGFANVGRFRPEAVALAYAQVWAQAAATSRSAKQ